MFNTAIILEKILRFIFCWQWQLLWMDPVVPKQGSDLPTAIQSEKHYTTDIFLIFVCLCASDSHGQTYDLFGMSCLIFENGSSQKCWKFFEFGTEEHFE